MLPNKKLAASKIILSMEQAYFALIGAYILYKKHLLKFNNKNLQIINFETVIIIIENGQFGNQLFQFNFCLKIAKFNEKIIFIGFDDLAQFIKKNKYFFFFRKKNLIIKSIIKFRILIINIINKLKITKTIIQEYSNHKIYKQKGLFNFITFVEGHFENEKFVNKNFRQYIKDSKIENDAIKFLKLFKKKNNQKIFFIQIRLKDAIVGIDKNYPSVLPLSWFIKCRNLIKKNFKNSLFIFLSDDINYLRENMKKNEIYVKNDNPFFSFYIMKNCDGGILSPSTFAWWAAYLSTKKKFLAPKYWHGHRKKVFRPHDFKTSFLSYKSVKKSEYLNQIRNEKKFYNVLPFK